MQIPYFQFCVGFKLLVQSGQPPTLLRVVQEDLETHFLNLIQNHPGTAA